MQTRSQTKLYSISSIITTYIPSSPVTRSQAKQNTQTFDFDSSSKEWLGNKTKLKNGMFSYKIPQHESTHKCGITTRSGLVLYA